MATCLPNISRLFHRPRPAAPFPHAHASSPQTAAACRPRIETFTYTTAATSSGGAQAKKDGMELRVDAYLPQPQKQQQQQQPGWPPPPPQPAVLFFHPGELLFGARADVLRALCDETTKTSYTLLSYTTRSLVPATAHDIVSDLTAAYAHYHTVLVPRLGLSSTNVFVCGVGTGVYVALLAAAHWEPKPLGVVGVVPRGCVFLGAAPGSTEPLATCRTDTLAVGPADAADGTAGLSPAADVPSSHRDYARRVALAEAVALRGEQLDLLTGLPGLAARLHAHRGHSAEELEKLVPETARAVLPELLIDETFPPVYLVCGRSGDEGTCGDRTLQESRALVRRLRGCMVLAQLVVADGVSHEQLCRGDVAVCRAPLAGVLPWLQQRCVADEGGDESDDVVPV